MANVKTFPATFDRFDVCESFYCLEYDFNVSGALQERPHTRRKRESVGFQLHRMGFKPRPNLSFNTLTDNGKAIYNYYVNKWNL